MIRLVQRDPALIDWEAIDRFGDRNIFQTREWLHFLTATQPGKPIVAEVLEGTRSIGYFTGYLVHRFGIPILGSSFRGWTTAYMGFNLLPEVGRGSALDALQHFAFEELGCLHLEIADPNLSVEDGARSGFSYTMANTFTTDLRQTETELFGGMTSACRRCIRKAESSGLIVEEARDEAFADDYYRQLIDVFNRQGLAPTYDVHRVRALIRHILPTGRLLLLRAMTPDGRCIATGIFPGMNKIAYFWGGASLTDMRHFRPNEAIQWYALLYWKARGMQTYEWGGGGDYKAKYGGVPAAIPWFRKSRYDFLESLRSSAMRAIMIRQRVRGWISQHAL